jgi:hypothetical protein
MFLSKLFRRKKKEEIIPNNINTIKSDYTQKYTAEPYNFSTVTANELVKKEDTLFDLYTNKADGYLIKNFLSELEVDTILSNLDKIIEQDVAHTDVGFTYPAVFAEFSNRIKQETIENKEKAIKSYFEKTTTFNENFDLNFGVNIKERIEKFFKAMSGNREILVAEGMEGKGNYPFATFRQLKAEGGMVSIHCGNYFGKTFEVFYKDLTKKVAVKNQMSFFIMLQEPESGGELTLFNFRWKDGQTKINASEDNEIIQPDGSKMYVEDNINVIKDKIAPKKGDMILFQGGNIWHRVEAVKGNTPRITFGGFMGISIDKEKFYYWS